MNKILQLMIDIQENRKEQARLIDQLITNNNLVVDLLEAQIDNLESQVELIEKTRKEAKHGRTY